MACDCDLRDRRWNPHTGKCEFCKCKYVKQVWPSRTVVIPVKPVDTEAAAKGLEQVLRAGLGLPPADKEE